MSEKIVVQNLTKVFGNAPEEALALLDQGLDKAEIFERTGQSIGVQNACFSVREVKSLSSWASRARENRPWCGCSTG